MRDDDHSILDESRDGRFVDPLPGDHLVGDAGGRRHLGRDRDGRFVERGEDVAAACSLLQVAIDVASLAPKADISVYPWKDPPDLKARTINRVRNFLKAHLPVAAAR
jgi:hypothetical protein